MKSMNYKEAEKIVEKALQKEQNRETRSLLRKLQKLLGLLKNRYPHKKVTGEINTKLNQIDVQYSPMGSGQTEQDKSARIQFVFAAIKKEITYQVAYDVIAEVQFDANGQQDTQKKQLQKKKRDLLVLLKKHNPNKKVPDAIGEIVVNIINNDFNFDNTADQKSVSDQSNLHSGQKMDEAIAILNEQIDAEVDKYKNKYIDGEKTSVIIGFVNAVIIALTAIGVGIAIVLQADEADAFYDKVAFWLVVAGAISYLLIAGVIVPLLNKKYGKRYEEDDSNVLRYKKALALKYHGGPQLLYFVRFKKINKTFNKNSNNTNIGSHNKTVNINSNNINISYDSHDKTDYSQKTYVFSGCFKGIVSAVIVLFLIAIVSGITVFAAPWLYNRNIIEFEYNGKIYTADANFKKKVHLEEMPEKPGYRFLGLYDGDTQILSFDESGYSTSAWSIKTNGKKYSLVPKFELIEYTITLIGNGGSWGTEETWKLDEKKTVSMEQTKIPNLSESVRDPSRTGYTFGGWGWSADGKQPLQDEATLTEEMLPAGGEVLQFYAKWEPNQYTLTFVGNDGFTSEGEDKYSQTLTYDKEAVLTANAFIREGYHFSGWNTKKGGSGNNYNDKNDVKNLSTGKAIELYAQWEPNQYTLTFVGNDGFTSEGEDKYSQTLTYDQEAVLTANAFIREGYHFSGWNTKKDGSGNNYNDKNDVKNLSTGKAIELYAQWSKISYTIIFYGNGGITPDGHGKYEQILFYDQKKVLSPNLFYQGGSSFVCWNTQPDGSGNEFADKAVLSDLEDSARIILYAQWKPIEVLYQVIDSGAKTARITGLSEAGSTLTGAIAIPDSVDGFTVVEIGDNAFEGCKFQGIRIPETVTKIGKNIFADADQLETITVEAANTKYYSCGNAIVCRDNDALIAGCKNSEISYGVRRIEAGAFDTVSIQRISIPATVKYIDEQAFVNCQSLAELSVDINNQYYARSDAAINCIITKEPTGGLAGTAEQDPKMLILGCKNSMIPSDGSVEKIGRYAFENCIGLISVTIPSTVTTIGDGAFGGCDNLIIYSEIASKPDRWVNGWNNGRRPVVWGSGTENEKVELGDFLWKFTDDQAVLIRYSGSSETVTVAEKVEFLATTYSVSAIAANAFKENATITALTILGGVSAIGDSAFSGCSSLTSVAVPASVTSIGTYAFSGCNSLTSVTFGENSRLASIGASAFRNCNSLASLVIAKSITSIGSSAFEGCISLANITFEENSRLTSIGSYVFYGCRNLTSVAVPASVTSIGSSAFEGCSKLTDITIPFVGNTLNGTENTHFGYIFGAATYSDNGNKVPDSLKTVSITNAESIASSAFRNCDNLASVTISESVTGIGFSAFEGCISLSSVTFGENSRLSSIGSSAFSGCSNLASVAISAGVTSINHAAFEGCISLGSVTFGENSRLASIGSSAFSGCSNLARVAIPASVTSIGASAFEGCSKLTDITLPFVGNTLSGIENTHFGYIFGAATFYDNAYKVPGSLKTVRVTSAEKIGSPAFYNCSSLTSIEISASVTSIGISAFEGCNKLADITLPFVGNTLNGTEDTHFGYIFGAGSYNYNARKHRLFCVSELQ